MNPESLNYPSRGEQTKDKEVNKNKETSPKRLMLAMELWKKMALNQLIVKGRENLRDIPRNQKTIVAITHSSDLDAPAAICALGNDLDLAISDESVHHSFKKEPDTNLGLHLAGKDNFLPIDFKKQDQHKTPAAFNVDNFSPMLEAMDNGKRLLIAAHNPAQKVVTAPPQPGYGAAYLAEMADALILPVAINVLSNPDKRMYEDRFKKILKKSDLEVIIGAPFKLEKIDNFERMSELAEKRKSAGHLSPQEMTEYSQLTAALRERSQQLLNKVLKLLPA